MIKKLTTFFMITLFSFSLVAMQAEDEEGEKA